MFFNPQQEHVNSAISDSVDRYGHPKIVSDGGLIRVSVGSLSNVQTLFVLDRNGTKNELVGVVVFVREDIGNMSILHVAVREDFSASGSRVGDMLVMRLINKVLDSASRIKGVRSVSLMYQAGGVRRIPVRHCVSQLKSSSM